MILKRYQFQGKEGVEWSDWYKYSNDDSELSMLQKQKWQLKGKYHQEFKIA